MVIVHDGNLSRQLKLHDVDNFYLVFICGVDGFLISIILKQTESIYIYIYVANKVSATQDMQRVF
jgi:hypothetical protein